MKWIGVHIFYMFCFENSRIKDKNTKCYIILCNPLTILIKIYWNGYVQTMKYTYEEIGQ